MKINKLYVIIFSLLMIIVSCVGQQNKVESISISYVDYIIMTTFKIEESYFEKAFNEDIKTIIIKDSLMIKNFMREMKKLKQQEYISTPNVRQKVRIKRSDGSVDILCLDGEAFISINGVPMYFNKSLQDLINKEIKKHEARIKIK